MSLSPNTGVTPTSSPGSGGKNVSPERAGGASQGHVSPQGSSSGDEKEKEKEVPRTPTLLSATRSTRGFTISPGGWSTAATPGQDDISGSSKPPSALPPPQRPPIPGITGRLMNRSSSPTKVPLKSSSSSSGSSGSPPLRPTVPNAGNDNNNRKPYEVVEAEHEIEVDGHEKATTGVRQDSWGSTVAHRGDSLPSRTSSRDQSWGNGEDDDGEGGVSTPFRSKSLSRDSTLSVIPETSSSTPSLVDADMQEDVHPTKASEVFTPLSQSQTIGSFHTTTSSVTKRVHFTPSVIGGLSSIASESPPASPGQSVLSIPLPSSNESDASDDTSRGGSLRKAGLHSVAELPPDNAPDITFTLPNGNGTPHPGAAARLSPIIQTVSLHQNGSGGSFVPGHNRSSSTGSSSSTSRSNGYRAGIPGSPPIDQTSPRLNPSGMKGINAIPPISATLPEIPTFASSFPLVPSPPMHTVLPSAPNLPLAPEASPPLPMLSFSNLPVTLPHPSAPPLPDMISAEDSAKVKKAAKYAVNALDYDDLDTARKELVRALAILGVKVEL